MVRIAYTLRVPATAHGRRYVSKIMKNFIFLTIIFLLHPIYSIAQEALEIDFYDRAHAIHRNQEEREANLMTQLDPSTASFYELWLPLQEARKKIERIGFMDKLKNSPESIDWSSTWEWATGFNSSAEEKDYFNNASQSEQQLYQKYLSQKKLMYSQKAPFVARNKTYKQHQEIMGELEENLMSELSNLQCEVDKVKLTNRYNEPQFRCFNPENPDVTNYEYNTIFSNSPYSENIFSAIKIGESKKEITVKLGPPLYEEKISFLHCMLFSNETYSLDPASAKHHGVDSAKVADHNVPFLALWFSEDVRVNFVFNKNYISKTQETELVGKNKSAVVKDFGQPREELLIKPCYFYSYTKIKEGPYTGHDQGIFIRRVYFDGNNRVIAVEKGDGPKHNIYSGIKDSEYLIRK